MPKSTPSIFTDWAGICWLAAEELLAFAAFGSAHAPTSAARQQRAAMAAMMRGRRAAGSVLACFMLVPFYVASGREGCGARQTVRAVGVRICGRGRLRCHVR